MRDAAVQQRGGGARNKRGVCGRGEKREEGGACSGLCGAELAGESGSEAPCGSHAALTQTPGRHACRRHMSAHARGQMRTFDAEHNIHLPLPLGALPLGLASSASETRTSSARPCGWQSQTSAPPGQWSQGGQHTATQQSADPDSQGTKGRREGVCETEPVSITRPPSCKQLRTWSFAGTPHTHTTYTLPHYRTTGRK